MKSFQYIFSRLFQTDQSQFPRTVAKRCASGGWGGGDAVAVEGRSVSNPPSRAHHQPGRQRTRLKRRLFDIGKEVRDRTSEVFDTSPCRMVLAIFFFWYYCQIR